MVLMILEEYLKIHFWRPGNVRCQGMFYRIFHIIQIESRHENKMADSSNMILQPLFALYIYSCYTSSFYIFKSIFELQKKKHQFSSFAAPRNLSYQRVLRTMWGSSWEPRATPHTCVSMGNLNI